MTSEKDQTIRHVTLLCLIGLWLVAVVFLLPNGGKIAGKSFLEGALATHWGNWGDWPAVWCSLKMILLSLGVFAIFISLGIFLMVFERINLARLILLSTVAPGLGFLIGLFYLVKALF